MFEKIIKKEVEKEVEKQLKEIKRDLNKQIDSNIRGVVIEHLKKAITGETPYTNRWYGENSLESIVNNKVNTIISDKANSKMTSEAHRIINEHWNTINKEEFVDQIVLRIKRKQIS